MFPLASSIFFTYFGHFEAITIAWWAQKVPDNTRQLAELVHIEDDIYGKNSVRGTIFLNCQTIRNSSMSISILKKFYCIFFILCVWGRMFIIWEMCTKKIAYSLTFYLAYCTKVWGYDFLHPFRLTRGTTQTPVQWVLHLFPGG